MFIFLRHFACVACRAHAKDVWDARERYEKAGAQLYFIGNGAPNAIKTFKENLAIQDAWVFTDPTLESFHAAGFKRGLLSPPVVRKRALVKARRMGLTDGEWTEEQGDQWQLGGVIAVKPGGLVTYHYISEAIGDYPSQDEERGLIKT